MHRLILELKALKLVKSYKFRHWLFAWNVDSEGDIVFSVANVLHFVKYKEHTIVKWGKQQGYSQAAKYVREVQ
jgi:hypothetical protein